MAIYCPQCGKVNPDDANFCMKCGKPLTVGSQAHWQPALQWEYCEIVYAELKPGGILHFEKIQFWAKAIGPQGEYNAGNGPEAYADQPGYGRMLSSGRSQSQYVPALNTLIARLTREGWEALPNRGDYWYSYKFRRQVR